MNSPLLIKLAKRKTGWRPQLVIDTETRKARRNACMVTNGKTATLVELEAGDLDNRQIDMALEMKVLEKLKQLEERDNNIMLREVIIFSAIASAALNQAQFFVPLVEQQAKLRIGTFKTNTEAFVNSIQKDAIGFHGEKMEMLLDNLEDATHRTFQKFGDAIIAGKLPQFIDYINKFDTTPESAEPKMKAVK